MLLHFSCFLSAVLLQTEHGESCSFSFYIYLLDCEVNIQEKSFNILLKRRAWSSLRYSDIGTRTVLHSFIQQSFGLIGGRVLRRQYNKLLYNIFFHLINSLHISVFVVLRHRIHVHLVVSSSKTCHVSQRSLLSS